MRPIAARLFSGIRFRFSQKVAGKSSLQDHFIPIFPMANELDLTPTEPGRFAFAAIAELAGILDADEATDWSKVYLEALRQHLIDMNNVTLRAKVTSALTDGGMRFSVVGDSATLIARAEPPTISKTERLGIHRPGDAWRASPGPSHRHRA